MRKALSLTQYLLQTGDNTDNAYAHVLSPVAIALKVLSATISRGSLILPSRMPDQVRDGVDQRWHADETDRTLQEAAVKTILTHGVSGDRLAAVSFSHEEEIHQVCDGPDARYLLAVDALHRPTSLIENQPIGLTFSIIERSKEGGPVTEGEFLRSGHDILCAGLALFGPTTILLVSTGEGVDAFTLDREVGNFVLTSADMTLPSGSDVLAIDLSHADTWSPAVRRYVDERIRSSQTGEGRPAIMRWNNSAVLGAFRAIMNGGIFLLPRLAPSEPGPKDNPSSQSVQHSADSQGDQGSHELESAESMPEVVDAGASEGSADSQATKDSAPHRWSQSVRNPLGTPEEGVPLIHTAGPIAMLIEQAGGAATNGGSRIADLVPQSLHERVPIMLGATADVFLIERYADEYEKGYGTEVEYPLFHNRTLFIQGT